MDMVTGSFGYIGKYITQELVKSGRSVRTITTHPNKPNPFGGEVESFPYNFNNPDLLTASLEGCNCLFNTYWIRFNYNQWTFTKALENTRILFNCAKKAGINKIVHISVTNPSESDVLPYYKGKAIQEKMVKESGIPWCIIRPTLVFGKEDILVNNIAWTIRTFPIVPIFGKGKYKVQPIFVGDLASLAVDYSNSSKLETLDAIGPETFEYKGFLQLLSAELNRHIYLMHISPNLGIILGKMIGMFLKDIILTKDELRGLMANKLISNQKPNGHTYLSQWISENKKIIGKQYTSELKRHFFWKSKDVPIELCIKK